MFSRFLPALLRGLPPENAHRIAIHGARWASHLSAPPVANICLRSQVLGMDLPHPIGLAAGFDKDAEAVSGLLALGFSFVEVGSITPLPQPGNPRPRVFRLPSDGAVINRYGFNSRGAQFASARLAHVRQQHPDAAVGINIGPNKTTTAIEQDLITCIEHLSAYASYLVINLSSPNTPGLRDNQAPHRLASALQAVLTARNDYAPTVPLLVKLSPDINPQDIKPIADVVKAHGVDGLILSNTSIARPAILNSPNRYQAGGLSGRPVLSGSTALLRSFYIATGGKIPLIGVGGVDSAQSAYEKIRAGASLVQLYTALVYKGMALVRDIVKQLPALLHADGFDTLSEAVGADHKG